jgi:hypothetical protein
MTGISTEWIRGLPKDEQEDFEKSLRHSTVVLSRLVALLDEQLKNLDRIENSVEVYDSPSWAYKQAHINGERSRLTKIRQLFNFLDS